jgi:predicted DCC family thiol-disulfide oxidoreductase YuxK
MTEPEQTKIVGHPILLYDGVCALCNHFVRFLLKRDRRAVFLFIPMESPLGREIQALPIPASPNQHSIPNGVGLITNALTPSEHIYHRSDAIAQTLILLENPWRSAGKALAHIPRPLRESIYGLIAHFRYQFFGRYTVCPTPTPDQRDRILGVNE